MVARKKTPISFSITLIFILLSAAIWLALGFIVAADLHPALPYLEGIQWMMSMVSLFIGIFLLGSIFFLRNRSRPAYFLTIVLLASVSILTIMDDFGLVDLVVLLINFIPFILLVKDRDWYLGSKTEFD